MNRREFIFEQIRQRGELTPMQVHELSAGTRWEMRLSAAATALCALVDRGHLVRAKLPNRKTVYRLKTGARAPVDGRGRCRDGKAACVDPDAILTDFQRVLRVEAIPIPPPATELERCWGRPHAE